MGTMKAHYPDIMSRLGMPDWWDENGTPRYDKFVPTLSPNIYAHQVALLMVACQGCGAKFKVAMTWGKMESFARGRVVPSLEDRVKHRVIHYGDPPNVGCCPAGPTMNSICERVLEFWKLENFEFVRVPELEVEIEGECNPEEQ